MRKVINCEYIVKKMIEENKSIREISNELGFKKSTLHNRLQKYKSKLDVKLLNDFEELMLQNKNSMHAKGGKCRYKNANKLKEE